MKSPNDYDVDDQLMDELGGAMDDYDAKKLKPIVIEIAIHPHGKEDEPKAEPDGDEGMLPTPEELDEMMRAHK